MSLDRRSLRRTMSVAAPGTTAQRAKLSRWKLVLFSLTPAVVLLATAELVVRAARLDTPSVRNAGLPEEFTGLLRLDPELFWALKPGLDAPSQGARVQTNALGLRSPPLAAKEPGELRILSLGESSTFGAGVDNPDTYTAVLGEALRQARPGRAITAINAGVSSYSSFQSLKYLEERGLALEPDLVLFYHEVNDYLPTTLRDSSDTEIGATKTDRQLYDSRVNLVRRVFVHSALFRFLTFRLAEWRLHRFDRREFRNPMTEVGLPALGIPGRLRVTEGDRVVAARVNEAALGRRVSEEERLQNLQELVALCKAHRIPLVVIHPSYRDSTRHECLLTRFCAQNGAVVFEAYDALHPVDLPQKALFWDSWHPTREGHRRLGKALADFLIGAGLV